MSAAKCQLNEAEKKLLKEKQARGVTVVGIDLASRVIQVCYLQKNGTLYNKPKTRDEFIKFLEEPKELLPDVFNANSKEEAEKLWNEWYELAVQSEVEEITRFASNQNKRYKEGIINSGIYHIRTSILEGINNKIKVLKRIAFGYRDSEYFFLRIKSAFRGKALST